MRFDLTSDEVVVDDPVRRLGLDRGDLPRDGRGDEVLATLVRAWEDITTEIEKVIDGGDRLVSIQRACGRAKGSGIEIELRYRHGVEAPRG